ncbi:MAG TPA: stage V sporulation protein T [Clostridiales bacterium]|nr:AbrB/MazE/SpoVT family DNA-binding domain-containing protein [Candidatus Apopatosoma intestinale]HBO66552.1 stage V sporulation protein T [Candidatus Apopatosoma intestinale]
MKATGIVRRIDDLGRVVIPKEIRRTMRIREGDPTLTTLTPQSRFIFAMLDLSKRLGLTCAE